MSNRDWFANAFGAAVEDIRHKLVEEGWFGRTVTPRTLRKGQENQADQRSLAEQFGWGKGTDDGGSQSHDTPENTAYTHQHGHDHDR